jgi:hypothetical protein
LVLAHQPPHERGDASTILGLVVMAGSVRSWRHQVVRLRDKEYPLLG